MSENGTNGVNVANGVQPVVIDNNAEDLEKKELELKRKERDPPIVFQDAINVCLRIPLNGKWVPKISSLYYFIDRYKTNWSDWLA